MTEKSVNEILEEAAQATAAAAEAKPKKERKPKAVDGGSEPGEPKAKKERTPKEPKAPKLYPQWNEDGTPLLDEAGNQVQGETRMKKPKVKRESTGTRSTFPATAVITLLVATNPKRGASAERFAKYVNGMTVGEAKDAGVLAADLKWDLERGFIGISGATADDPTEDHPAEETAESAE